jgi:hypothetical protein
MIAAAGHQRFITGYRSGLEMDVTPMWPLTSG